MRLRSLFIACLALSLLLGCRKEPISDFQYANVSASYTKGNTNDHILVGDELKFYLLRIDGESYIWDFGDGTSSTELSPRHIYKAGGTYSVKLTVNNGSKSSFVSKSITIIPSVIPPLPPSSMIYTSGYGTFNCVRFDMAQSSGYLSFLGVSSDSAQMILSIPYPCATGNVFNQTNASMEYNYVPLSRDYQSWLAPSTFTVTITATATNNIKGSFGGQLYRSSGNFVSITNGTFDIYFP